MTDEPLQILKCDRVAQIRSLFRTSAARYTEPKKAQQKPPMDTQMIDGRKKKTRARSS